MNITENEIFSQPEALKQTFSFFEKNSEIINDFFVKSDKKKIIFFGCGSSYMLAKTAREIFNRNGKWQTFAIASGDYLISPNEYNEIIKDGIVIFLTRSGLTTEILKAAEIIQKKSNTEIMSITMEENNGLKDFSSFNIVLPWAYDKSVCQTRTVTTFYVSLLLLKTILENDFSLKQEIKTAIDYQIEFIKNFKSEAKRIAERNFDNVIVLADGALEGLAEEGALAFTEIAMIHGQYFHVLDYRHGPIVLNNSKTLNIVNLRPNEEHYQCAMLKDLNNINSTLVTLSKEKLSNPKTFSAITIPFSNYLISGIFLINICQIVALEKSYILGNNPDKPVGLDAYISL